MDSGSTSDKHLALSTVIIFCCETSENQVSININWNVMLLHLLAIEICYYLSCLSIKGTEKIRVTVHRFLFSQYRRLKIVHRTIAS